MQFKVGNFYRTRDGQKVVCVAFQPGLRFPVQGVVLGTSSIEEFKANGCHFLYKPSNLDLVAEWCDPEVRYVNLYWDPNRAVHLWKTREAADSAAAPDRVSCIKLEVKDGQYDD